MLEGLMLAGLAVMGLYFIKSTDLPKDMKERSEQSRLSSPLAASPKKYAFPVEASKNLAVKKISEKSDAEKLTEIENQIRRKTLIALQNQKIDELTLLITTLELEIRANNEKNAEIQAKIDIHLEELRILKESKIS